VLIDGHNDLAWELRARFDEGVAAADFAGGLPGLHTDLPRLRAGRVAAQFWSVWVPSSLPEPDAVVATLEQIDLVRRLVAATPALELVTTADGIERAHRAGRIGSLIGVEGGHAIAGSLAVLRQLHRLGARYLTLTHNDNTAWADSATGGPGVGGLSAFGREVVAEANRLGVMVDLSHTADATMRAALASTTAPVIFSHSNARALCDVPRNVPDDVLALMPANGGVVMATFVARYVTSAARATIDDVVAQLEYLRATIGIDHIGLGADFDGDDDVTTGLDDVSCYPRLFDALRARSWSGAELDAVAGRNILRVMRDVEAVAEVY
jgi:membrane dipeptidase